MSVQINITTTENGNLETINANGWTGRPEYNEFTPSYLTTSNKNGYCDAKLSTYLLCKDDEGERISVRLNFWGEIAEVAAKYLIDDKRVANIELINARVTRYRDKDGIERYSANVNHHSQLDIHTVKKFVDVNEMFSSAIVDDNNAPF